MKGDHGGGDHSVTCLAPVDRVPEERRGDLGMRLREKRTSMKLKIHEFAHWIGVPYRTYHDWELGNKVPSAAAMCLLELKLKEKV